MRSLIPRIQSLLSKVLNHTVTQHAACALFSKLCGHFQQLGTLPLTLFLSIDSFKSTYADTLIPPSRQNEDEYSQALRTRPSISSALSFLGHSTFYNPAQLSLLFCYLSSHPGGYTGVDSCPSSSQLTELNAPPEQS